MTRYSMGLKDVAKKYSLMRTDARVLSNRHAIDVIDERVLELIDRVDVEDAPERMRVLYDLFQQVKAAKGRNEAAMYAALSAMDLEFERAYHDYEAWEQIFKALELRRKMVEGEVKVIKDMKAILTAEQAYNLVAKLMAAVIDIVKEPRLLRQINYRFSRIIGEHDLREPAEVVELNGGEEENEGRYQD